MQLDITASSLPTGDGCVRKQTGLKSAAYLSAVVAMLCATTAMASDDNSTFGTMSDMLGITSNKQMEKIDYSERPKLVMPPKVDALPAPRERQFPEGWPVDADSGTRRTDRFARHPNAPPEKPKPTLLENLHGPHRKPTDAPKAEEEGDGGGIFGSFQNLRTNRARLNEEEGPAPTRNLLSEPPDGLRTPTQDLSKLKDTEKKDSWWNFFGSSGETADAKKPAAPDASKAGDAAKASAPKNPPAPAPAADSGGEKSGFMSKMSDMISGK